LGMPGHDRVRYAAQQSGSTIPEMLRRNPVKHVTGIDAFVAIRRRQGRRAITCATAAVSFFA
jgi:hypothetical protein